MTATGALSVALVFLSVLLTGVLMAVGFLVKSYVASQRRRDETLTRLTSQFELLNQGASHGARELIRAVAGRVDVLESAAEVTDDRLNVHDTKLEVMDTVVQGHIRARATIAHEH